MIKRIAFRHMESTPVLEEYINKHLEKIEKLLSHERTPIYLDIVVEALPIHAHHKVELLVKTPNYDLVAHHEGPDMYKQIHDTCDIMVEEIRRAKERLDKESKTKDWYKGV